MGIRPQARAAQGWKLLLVVEGLSSLDIPRLWSVFFIRTHDVPPFRVRGAEGSCSWRCYTIDHLLQAQSVHRVVQPLFLSSHSSAPSDIDLLGLIDHLVQLVLLIPEFSSVSRFRGS